MKKTVIITYPMMKMGGIEKWIAGLMEYSINKGYRVIWLTTKHHYNNSDFKKITCNTKVEKYFPLINILSWYPKINFHKDEHVTMISFDPLSYVCADHIRTSASASFDHLMILPHFTGNVYYPERGFTNCKINRLLYSIFQQIAFMLNKNNSIYAFSLKQLECYEKNYHTIIREKYNKLIKSVTKIKGINNEEIFNKAVKRNHEFIIITCSRLEFPHKGYIIGLQKAYFQLKQSYKNLKLIVVGEGPGKEVLLDKCKKVSDEVNKDIIFTGTLSPGELDDIMKTSHVNVGLAGALLVGAKLGVPSLNVRHFSETCETYGFISDNNAAGLRTDTGKDIIPYIEKLINCSDLEYTKQAISDYAYVNGRDCYDPEFIFRQHNNYNKQIDKVMQLKCLLIRIIIVLKNKILGAKYYEKNDE